jgi:hypothetical protein
MAIARFPVLCLALFAAACGDDGANAGGGGAGAGEPSSTGSAQATSSKSGNSASGSGVTGSSSASGAGGEGTGGQAPFMLVDPLLGSTAGLQQGGSLGPDGWTVTGNADRIIYELPRLVSGSVEFTVSNIVLSLEPGQGNLTNADHEIFALYDGGYDVVEPVPYSPDFRDNHYKSMIRVYGQLETGREGQQKIMWGMCPSGAPGHGACGCQNFFEEPFGGDGTWDGTPQRLRVEWGDGFTRYLRNQAVVLEIDWSQSGLGFGPDELHISLGTSRPLAVGTASMPIGAVFSDLVVEGLVGSEVATCP